MATFAILPEAIANLAIHNPLDPCADATFRPLGEREVQWPVGRGRRLSWATEQRGQNLACLQRSTSLA